MKQEAFTEERVWAVLSHLSALAFGMGLFLPIIGWSEQRRKSNYASFQCLQALGYQSLGYTVWLLTTLVVVMALSIASVAGLVNAEFSQEELMAFVFSHVAITFGLIGVYFVLPVIAAVACALGKDFRYPILGNRLAHYLGYSPVSEEGERTWLIEDHEDRWVTSMGHFAVIIALWGMVAPLSAWALQGKRSLFLKFQSIQTLVFQASTMLLYVVAGGVYMFGFFALLITTGFGQAVSFEEPGGMIGLVILLISSLVAIVIVMTVPLFHILGQWAGYRILKGDNYRYPIVGRMVEKQLAKNAISVEEKPV
jgi:uncharacterized Tic20 family protein